MEFDYTTLMAGITTLASLGIMAIVKIDGTKTHRKIDQNNLDNVSDHKRIFTVLDRQAAITDPMLKNRMAYNKIIDVADEASRLKDDIKYQKYNMLVAEALISFSRVILDKGIDNVTDETIMAKADFEIARCFNFFKQCWGSEILGDYDKFTHGRMDRYIIDVKHLSEENFNSKDQAFRDITFLYMRDITKLFTHFYDNYNLKEVVK